MRSSASGARRGEYPALDLRTAKRPPVVRQYRRQSFSAARRNHGLGLYSETPVRIEDIATSFTRLAFYHGCLYYEYTLIIPVYLLEI